MYSSDNMWRTPSTIPNISSGERGKEPERYARLADPLPLSELIFLYTDDDIHVWLRANPGKDPLNLLVLESRKDQGEGQDEN